MRGQGCWNGEGGEGILNLLVVYGERSFVNFCLFWMREHKNDGFRRNLFLNIENASLKLISVTAVTRWCFRVF
jgi:hypothetical protein